MKSFSVPERLRELVDTACTDGAGDMELRELSAALREDESLRRFHAAYCRMHAELFFLIRAEKAIRSVREEQLPPKSEPVLLGFLGGAYHGTMGFFSQEVPFACLIATVLCGLGIWIGSLVTVSRDVQISQQPSPPVAEPSVSEKIEHVGRITGMVDVRWAEGSSFKLQGSRSANHKSEIRNHKSFVALGDKFALASGLMEITYDTGAKVILQGPVTYKVESGSGGYLSIGKLTARLESREERSGERGEGVANHKSEIINHKSSLSTTHYPLFTIKTPTATVTDLGTEFGVEVDREGHTDSHVFAGRVKIVRASQGNNGRQEETLLHAGETASVDARNTSVTAVQSDQRQFVRALPMKQDRDSEAYAQLVLSLNPVVYYRMERPRADKDQLQIFDSASGGHHGLLDFDKIGFKDADYTPGRFGDALFFRGENIRDHVLVPDYPKTTNNQLTVSAWVMAVDRSLWPMIVGNWSATSRGHFHFGLFAGADESDLAVSIAQRNHEQVYAREGPSHPFPLGLWQHVAFVCDKTVVRLYRNGVEVASTPCDGLLAKPEVPFLSIGSSVADDGVTMKGGFWYGRIDELAIFNRALSTDDVRRLCDIGKVSGVNLRNPSDPSATTQEENGLSKKGGDVLHE